MSTSDFKIIRPITVTAAMLTSSTVPEATPAAYNAGTTYADGNIVYTGTVGGVLTVWESLQNSNTGNTPSSSPLWWVNIGSVYAEYNAGTTYALGDIIQVAATHKVYESLAAGNIGNAVTDTTKWLYSGATNRWKCFDVAVNSQTSAPNSITIVLTPGELINSVALLNIDGASLTVSQSISGYSNTQSLQSHEVLNWYDWYYEDIVRTGDVVLDDIPPHASGVLTITITATGGTASVGCVIIGKARTIGTTLWEATGGVISYSTTTTDVFGNVTIVRRSNAKRLNLDVMIASGFEDEAHRLLSLYTDTEMVFVGSSSYSMSIIYGYLGQWDVPISLSGRPASIEIRGLI